MSFSSHTDPLAPPSTKTSMTDQLISLSSLQLCHFLVIQTLLVPGVHKEINHLLQLYYQGLIKHVPCII
uniref:Uncharacterized protein n=1 Tax=Arundo donax TaxID=35708 RepID=A0A0A9D1H5_ARUDO